jgi:pimeloyl-ACP methyl ester carboxylesterase
MISQLANHLIQNIWVIILVIAIGLTAFISINYQQDIQQAYERLDSYQPDVIMTEYGKTSYLDEGAGEVILLSHGIFGGYDQAIISLRNLLGDKHRKLAPSRFGYPGSDLPSMPTPENQAHVFADLLDELGIDQAFVITTSAGGAAGIQFAIQYPHRVKGLILLSSGVPAEKKNREELKGLTGPPDLIVNDFPMWFSLKFFGGVMNMMFGATEPPEDLYNTLLPVKPRKTGIKMDETITNLDMDIHFDDYPVEKITAPILVVHAKDDPMAKFEGVNKFIQRTKPQTALFETGGHLITGQGDAVSEIILAFIDRVANENH